MVVVVIIWGLFGATQPGTLNGAETQRFILGCRDRETKGETRETYPKYSRAV